MRHLSLVALVLALLAAACTGETFVEYRGAVVAGDATGHSFDANPNPAQLPPVPDATVTLFVCSGACDGSETGRQVTADEAGEWGPLDLTFGGGFTDHEIRIEVAAPGFTPYRYSTTYESTTDPTAGERYLNVVLAP